MIHTPTHLYCPTNPISLSHPTLHSTQDEFSQIHPNSLSNRTIRSIIQFIQRKANHHPIPLPHLSFSLSPAQNSQMNKWNSNIKHRNRNHSPALHSEWNGRMSKDVRRKRLAFNTLNPSTTLNDAWVDLNRGIVNCDTMFYPTASRKAIYNIDSISS